MIRFLAHLSWIPFTGDRRYHGLELWSARHEGKAGGTLERFWIDKFLQDAKSLVQGPRCLEWGIWYTNAFPQCVEKYEMRYEEVFHKQTHPHVEGNIIYGSIYQLHNLLGPTFKLNLICATQLFEHLENPGAAAHQMFQVLAPGGAVLVTAPQQAQYHKVPEDFLRYTKAGLKHIFEVAGFCVPLPLVSGSGDFIFDISRDLGLQTYDFTAEEMMDGYQQGFDAVADGAITIQAIVYKPPHSACR